MPSGSSQSAAFRWLRWRWVAIGIVLLEPALHLFGIPHPELGQQALNLLAVDDG